ncbi:MAG: DUF1045 domain-containing protein [Pseudomonadota bacterium]
MSERFAVYFQPPNSTPLGAFGASVLGYDASAGAPVAHRSLTGVSPEELATWTATPRTYGFHATLKAPFHLADGVSAEQLSAAVATLAQTQPPIRDLELIVQRLGSFIALVPPSRRPDLSELADACVTELDHLRAPMTAADRARRNPDRLTEDQRANLDRWGYPFVRDEFRFHCTLTGRLSDDDLDRAESALSAAFTEVPQPVAITELAIARQDAGQRFVVVSRHPLGREGS